MIYAKSCNNSYGEYILNHEFLYKFKSLSLVIMHFFGLPMKLRICYHSVRSLFKYEIVQIHV